MTARFPSETLGAEVDLPFILLDEDFGLVVNDPDAAEANSEAFVNAMESVAPEVNNTVNGYGNMGGRLPEIILPKGHIHLAETLHIKRIVAIRGAGVGGHYPGTELVFPDETPGIVLDYYTDSDDGGRADFGILRGFGIRALGRSDDTAHGIEIRTAETKIEDVGVWKFGGNGIHIDAGVPGSNANLFTISNVTLYYNKNGLYTHGNDSNAGLIQRVDASYNDEWGFSENSFLGNIYIACHAASNGGDGSEPYGGYMSSGAVNTSVFYGCYCESGQGAENDITPPSTIFGGINMGEENTAAAIKDDGTSGHFVSSPIKVRLQDGTDPDNYVLMGGRGSVESALATAHGDDGVYNLQWASGRLRFILNQGGSNVPLEFSGADSAEGDGQLRAPNGVYLSGQNVKVLAGPGTPEGNVTGAVGWMYLRIDGGAGTTLYIKESGAGNTGWVGK